MLVITKALPDVRIIGPIASLEATDGLFCRRSRNAGCTSQMPSGASNVVASAESRRIEHMSPMSSATCRAMRSKPLRTSAAAPAKTREAFASTSRRSAACFSSSMSRAITQMRSSTR